MPDVPTAEIDEALRAWRQGDLALDERWFVHVGDPARPLTAAAREEQHAGEQALTSEVEGLAIITQTCDIVRTCVDRPYLEVAPIVRLEDDEQLRRVRRGQVPSLATVPALVGASLAVDLDRVMTVEKSVAANWKRTVGCTNDAEMRAFAQALARKRARFAFPDDFTEFVKRLRARLLDKHERNTDEGRGLRALREIRVGAEPDWNSTNPSLFFWFVREDADPDSEGKSWVGLLDSWLALMEPVGRYVRVEGLVCTLGDMTAEEYVATDPLDLAFLSLHPAKS